MKITIDLTQKAVDALILRHEKSVTHPNMEDDVYIQHTAKNGEFGNYKIQKLDVYWQIFVKCLELSKLREKC